MSHRLPLAIAAALSLCVLAPGFAHAADDPDEKSASALRAGAWALQFRIGPDFQLGSFDGSAISIKHHYSAGSAWRLGVSTRFSSVSRDESIDWVLPDTTFLRNDDIDDLYLNVGATHLWYPHPGQRVSAYYGAGPFVSLSRSDRTVEDRGETGTDENHGWAAGGDFVFGGEWFPARSIGIHAEYRADLSYSKSTMEFAPPRRAAPRRGAWNRPAGASRPTESASVPAGTSDAPARGAPRRA